jgi:anti-sigma-K factor RskA
VLLAYASRHSDELWLKPNEMQSIDSAKQVFELWGLPKEPGGAPRSLGLLPQREKTSIKLAAAADQTLSDFPALAVSLEPAGGSKTGLPTGPVLYSGPCLKFW